MTHARAGCDYARRMTYAEYLAREQTSEVKHEYRRGEVWPHSATPKHARLTAAVSAVIANRLRGTSFIPYASTLRVRIESTDRATYPDLTVICGTEQPASDDPDAITNPTVIVEVLSESTERYDPDAPYRVLRGGVRGARGDPATAAGASAPHL